MVTGSGAAGSLFPALSRLEPGISTNLFQMVPTWERGTAPPRLPAGGTWLRLELLPQQLQQQLQQRGQRGQHLPAIMYFADGTEAWLWARPAAAALATGSAADRGEERVLVCLASGTSRRGVGCATLVRGSGSIISKRRQNFVTAVLRADTAAAEKGKGRAERLVGSGGMYVLDQHGNLIPGKCALPTFAKGAFSGGQKGSRSCG